FSLQQIEAQPPGHGLVALAAFTGAGGDGFAERQTEVVAGKLQSGRLRCAGEWLVDIAANPVVAAGGDGQLAASLLDAELNQADMQVAAGVQGNRSQIGSKLCGCLIAHYVLRPVVRMETQALAQFCSGVYQCRVPFQAGQGCAAICQLTPQMTFACAPVEPMPGLLAKVEGCAK